LSQAKDTGWQWKRMMKKCDGCPECQDCHRDNENVAVDFRAVECYA
jgi:hypothetical protein